MLSLHCFKRTGKRILLLFSFTFSFQILLAQSAPIVFSGQVSSSDENKPLQGVTVSIGTKSTLTDAEGKFSISLPKAMSVKISYSGYNSQTIAVSESKFSSIVLIANPQMLETVTVTALGNTRKTKSLTYAAQTIKPTQLTEVRDASVVNTLQGKIAGAVISQGPGGVGGSTKVVLRGNRFVTGSNNALFVVDGIPINNETRGNIDNDFGGVVGGDGISNINPDDIESVTVLRGASAAALYGSQAANGAIIITTKKGKDGKIQVDVNSGVSVETVLGLPDFQNKYGQGVGGTIDPSVGESWGAEMKGQNYTNLAGQQRQYTPQNNNVRDFFQRAPSFNNSISVSGGTAKVQTYFSYSNNLAKGIVPGNSLNRNTFNFRITNQITDRLSTDLKLTYINQEVKNIPRAGENNSAVFNSYQMGRSLSKEDAMQFETINSIGIPTPSPYASTLASIYQNPYWNVNRTSINQGRDRILSLLSVKYKVFPWLNIQGRANIDKSYDNANEQYHQGTLLFAGTGGTYTKSKTTINQQWFDLMFTGNANLTKNFSVNYQLGSILSDYKNDNVFASAQGLTIPNRFNLFFATNPAISENYVRTQTQSVFGQVNFSFKDAIFLDASLRKDWTSTLPKPHSFAYPSLGLSVILSDLLKMPKFLSYLKLSGTFAEVGNAPDPYLLTTNYSYTNVVGLSGIGYITRDRRQALGDLQAELSRSYEANLEAKFLNNRLGFTVTGYKTNSLNQLLLIDLPVATGFGSRYFNAGNIENKGIEVVISGTPISKKNFSWDVIFNYGANKNKVISLGDINNVGFGGSLRAAQMQVEVGQPFGNLFAFGWAKNTKGEYVVSNDGLPIRSDRPTMVGNSNPKATLGLNNTLNYKNFSLRFLVDGRVGGVGVSGTEMNLAFSGLTKRTEENRAGGWVLPAVKENGDKNVTPINAEDFWRTVSGGRTGWAEFFTYDQTSFRLREVSFGYTLPLKTKLIKVAKLSFVARNVMWLYRGFNTLQIPGLAKGRQPFDPDMSLSTTNFQGLDYAGVPSSRSIGLNLRVTF